MKYLIITTILIILALILFLLSSFLAFRALLDGKYETPAFLKKTFSESPIKTKRFIMMKEKTGSENANSKNILSPALTEQDVQDIFCPQKSRQMYMYFVFRVSKQMQSCSSDL